MELFFKFDQLRLKAFQESALENNIDILSKESYTAYCFQDVEYFNYLFLNDSKRFDVNAISEVQVFYENRKISTHKIILKSDRANKHQALLDDSGYQHKQTIVKTTYPLKLKEVFFPKTKIGFEKVNQNNIYEYTVTYLNSFEAVARNFKRVSENFKMLLTIEGFEAYVMKVGGEPVGIVALFIDSHDYFLAMGAVLKEYRNLGYHKAGLTMRLRKIVSDPYVQSIISWAYKGSISHQNMLKLKMKEECQYSVYEYSDNTTQ